MIFSICVVLNASARRFKAFGENSFNVASKIGFPGLNSEAAMPLSLNSIQYFVWACVKKGTKSITNMKNRKYKRE